MEKYPLIRKIYLYLFSMVGLVLIIIGTARFVDMGLKTYVFTKAYEQQRIEWARPAYIDKEFIAEIKAQTDLKTRELTEDQYQRVKYIISEYENWELTQKEIDPITSQKHRDASGNLAMMLVGLPLYLYHWLVIRKELKA